MKFKDMPPRADWSKTRDAFNSVFDGIHCEGWNDVYHITIKDWRVKRKWRVKLDYGLGIFDLIYNKKSIKKSDDLIEIRDAVLAHNSQLTKRYDQIKINKATKEGDIAPFIMEAIRSKAHSGMAIAVNEYDWATGLTIDYNKHDVYICNIRIGVTFKERIIELDITSCLGQVKRKFDMANPSFNPEAWVDWLMQKADESIASIVDSVTRNEAVWN